MSNHIYTINEVLDKTGISLEQLAILENEKVLIPLGRSDDNNSYYASEHVSRIEHIQKLLDLGYKLEDIRKIIRKVGIPSHQGNSLKQSGKTELLTIGILAEKIGISTRTIKHWEEKGIIEPDMRSQGGFRLYSHPYIYFGCLIKDLQHFGYTLDEIKIISDHFRHFFIMKGGIDNLTSDEIERWLTGINSEIEKLNNKIGQLKQGISRWEELVKKNRKELTLIHNRSLKRTEKKEG